MSTDEYLGYRQIMAELRKAVHSKRTGTLFVATEDNNLLRVTLADGQITSLSYRRRHGTGAVPLVRTIAGGRVRFSGGSGQGDKSELPTTEHLLELLDAAATPAPRIASGRTKGEMLRIIQSDFVDILGPVAHVIWEEQIGQGYTSIESLIGNLAQQIPDEHQAREFVAQVGRSLAGIP